jgi:copper homeostasis protein CutC
MTNGMAVSASISGRTRLELCASHQASGVASTSSTAVVIAASLRVSQMALISVKDYPFRIDCKA